MENSRYEAALLRLLREAQARRERAEWEVRYWEARLGELYQNELALSELSLKVDRVGVSTPTPAD